jgi:hypothetical protein|tara:strand:+ start:1146 stop:1415 length:270 start_codon:yes stop_codon:yes gene_type:complete
MSSITPIKTGDSKTDKMLSTITKQMGTLQESVKMKTGSQKTKDLKNGEFVFSVVKKDSESPGYPTSDEGRLYFKVSGILYQLTGVKVGG